MIRLLTALIVALLSACAAVPAVAAPPPIRHVFVIVLENEDESTSFGPGSQAPYLARTLVRQGGFLANYYGTGHNSNDNYLTMISGQAPNPATQADCGVFADFLPGTPAPFGQVRGEGCVYPRSVQTIAGQLRAKGLEWKGYMEDMGIDPHRDSGTACAHPPIGQPDPTQAATATDQYATRHNPFVYFHSIIDDEAACKARDVPLTRLPHDLARASRTPNLSYIVPDLCNDGHDAVCPNGGLGGLPAANAWLQRWVPRITRSPAFRRDGLLLVTFDEALASSDSSACCNEPHGPNTTNPGFALAGPGGGRIGAVVLSPFVRPGTRSTVPYNHYSLLRSMEDIFGLGHLGYAAQKGLRPFGADLYTRRRG
jgi:hypothetical protein